jgi:Fur family transcriptional regulator, ferric uptake regulator
MKSDVNIKAGELLDSANLRQTSPRIAILAVLLRAKGPVSQDHIAASVGAGAPNKVTIYRTLESFIAAGLVHKVFLQEKSWHFELSHRCTEEQCHPHFICTACGDTHCLTGLSVPMAKSPPKGFVIRRQRVQLEGLCPKCSPAEI